MIKLDGDVNGDCDGSERVNTALHIGCDYLQVNFGCILNDTEVTRYVNITNNSPQEVKYKWSFLLEEGVPVTTYHSLPTPPPQVIYPLQRTTVYPHLHHR